MTNPKKRGKGSGTRSRNPNVTVETAKVAGSTVTVATMHFGDLMSTHLDAVHPDEIVEGIYHPPESEIWDMRAKDVKRFYERVMAARGPLDLSIGGIVNNGIFGNREKVKMIVRGID